MKKKKKKLKLASWLMLILMLSTLWGSQPEDVEAYDDITELEVTVGFWGMQEYTKKVTTLDELARSCGTHREIYTWIDQKPAAGTTEAEGIYIYDLMEYHEINQSEVRSYNFFTLDSETYAKATEQWTPANLYATRYTYRSCFERVLEEYLEADKTDYVTYPESYYHLSDFYNGSEVRELASYTNEVLATRKTVPAMLALKTYAKRWEGQYPEALLDYSEIRENDNPQLLFGQTGLKDSSRSDMAKMVYKIHVWYEGYPTITTNVTSLEGGKGDTAKITTIVKTPEDSTDSFLSQAVAEDLTWESSNPDVAAVDEYGNVTFIGEGTASITLSYKDDNGNIVASTSVGVTGTGEGSGNGNGNGAGDGNGDGNGAGDGNGDGNGAGDGNSDGNGAGDGNGDGNDAGDGNGDGNNAGDGNGGDQAGDGSGAGNGNGGDQADDGSRVGDRDGGDEAGNGSGVGNGDEADDGNIGSENPAGTVIADKDEETNTPQETHKNEESLNDEDEESSVKDSDKVVVVAGNSLPTGGSSSGSSGSSGGGNKIFEYSGEIGEESLLQIEVEHPMKWIFIFMAGCIICGAAAEGAAFAVQAKGSVTDKDFKKLISQNTAKRSAPEWNLKLSKPVKTILVVMMIAIFAVGARIAFGPTILWANISEYENEQIQITGLQSEDFYVTPGELAELELTKVTAIGSSAKAGTVQAVGPSLDTFLETYGGGVKRSDIKQIKFYGSDGYNTTLVKTVQENEIILSIANGKDPLWEGQWPLRIVIPEDDSSSWIRLVTKIEFTLN